MQLQEIVDRLGALKDTATVERVFGEGQMLGTRMIIPVAEVRTGLGIGFGTGKISSPESKASSPDGEGGGGGGGAMARPVGVVEVTAEGTQFIPIKVPINPLLPLLLGLGVGVILAAVSGKNCKTRVSDEDKA